MSYETEFSKTGPIHNRPVRASLPALVLAALAASMTALLLLSPVDSQATLPATVITANTVTSYEDVPLTSAGSVPPTVMLNISRDHQLFYKAYNDYSDLDNDGAPETTYKHSINYYGYFDSGKCYTYTNNRYEPASITSTKYCNAGTTTGQWSGNFLNWVSMTRFDAVRKLLYGGTRSTDNSTDTVLERVALPTDAHSFAKYYNGTDTSGVSDISRLTPFTGVPTAAPTAVSNSNLALGTGSRVFNITSGSLDTPSLGDQVTVVRTTNAAQIMRGYVTATATGSVTIEVYSIQGSGTFNNWTLTNLSRTGLSFCSTTWAASDQTAHGLNTNTYPPLLRVARGNFELWGANERWQCYWREEQGDTANISASGRNANLSFFSNLNASSANPRKDTHALGTGSNAGASNTNRGEFIVRVRACVSGLEGAERCKTYPSGNKKPIGLLQVYGDDDRVRFGLMTSSYQRNVSGGVLRKNIGSFRDETNENTDGSFSGAPVPDVDLTAATAFGGIVDTLNRLRMWGYKYSDGTYISADRENCDFQLVGIAATGTTAGSREVTEGNCASWGNPVGEVYMESLRYLAGIGNTTAFNYGGTTNNKDASLGLDLRTFSSPLDNTNYCSNLNVLTFTASVSSYDNDQMGGLSALRNSPNVLTFTDSIGAAENIHGGNWFIGNAPGNLNQLCTGKTINNLSAVDGICPEASAIEGSFQIGGAALYARTNRIRSDFPASGGMPVVPPANDTSSLKVTSYGIELATNTPSITVLQPGTGRKVSIQPVYRLDRSSTGAGPFGSGAIVDFRIVSQDTVNGRGSFYVNWEDSTQGGDYDQDMYGLINYEFLPGNQIRISTDAVAAATANGQGFGYIISGTTQDGPHFHSGILNYDYLNEAAGNPITVRDPLGRVLNNTAYADYGNRVFINTNGGCQDCVVNDPPTSVTYSLGAAAAGVLKSPLYYMAKYGGFTDSNNNNLPDLVSEWDSRLADGSGGSDGVPDTYFLVSNPTSLESALAAALDAIVAKASSGTAAAVVASDRQGQGVVYQALYEPVRPDKDITTRKTATWIGTVQAFFVDSLGRLREDGNQDGALNEASLSVDPIVKISYDPSSRTTRVTRNEGGTDEAATLETLKPIWNARKQLSSLTSVAQRSYASLASTGRYIFTFLDYNRNLTADSSEQVEFVDASFPSSGASAWGMLNTNTRQNALDIISYIRGNEGLINGKATRNRTIKYLDANDTAQVMRLGDIVNSSPTVVSTPAEAYDLLYNDTTYGAYFSKYRQRRSVVYVGGNDGMLHAFNGGFYNPSTKTFALKNSLDAARGLGSEVQHPLGSELWAYVPFNLLPHLTWLTDPDYRHVSYVDGKPRIFDARIFPDDATHPGGWGTVLVAGFRFGGGPLTMTAPDLNAFSKFDITVTLPTPGTRKMTLGDPLTTRPAYVVMDITNPEAPPTLLAEITDSRLGFTTGLPTIATFKGQNPGDTEGWYLVFGNGPESRNAATSSSSTPPVYETTQNAGLYMYQLNFTGTGAAGFLAGFNPKNLPGATNSFVGDPVSVDWELDYKSNAIYVGTIGNPTVTTSGTSSIVTAQSGQLFKLGFGTPTSNTNTPANWKVRSLLNPGNPVISTPSVTQDEFGRHFIFGGTGRFYFSADKPSRVVQSLFGMIDTTPDLVSTDNATPALTYSSLVDTSSAVVRTTGAVSGITGFSPAVTSQNALISKVIDQSGWRLTLSGAGTSIAERNLNASAVLGDIVFMTAFTPSSDLCQGDGSSRLFGLYYKTGAPLANQPVFGLTPMTTDEVLRTYDLSGGLAAAPGLRVNGSTAATALTVITQTSSGSIQTTDANVKNSIRSREIDWRENHP